MMTCNKAFFNVTMHFLFNLKDKQLYKSSNDESTMDCDSGVKERQRGLDGYCETSFLHIDHLFGGVKPGYSEKTTVHIEEKTQK